MADDGATALDEPQRAAICRACELLVLRAAAFIDANEPARLVEVFTVDAVLVRPNGIPLSGHEPIVQAYANRPPDRITRHLVTNTLVEVESPTEACATSYVLLWTGSTDDAAGAQGRPARAPPVVGEFVDRFVHVAEGWRIARRAASFVLHAINH
jgi:hypothetical protein